MSRLILELVICGLAELRLTGLRLTMNSLRNKDRENLGSMFDWLFRKYS
jgi:hypothetical protein